MSKPLPERHLKTRKQGGQSLTYIEWHPVIRYLDHYVPGRSYEVRSVSQIGERCVVVVRITIPCLEGTVFREATGTEDEELKGYGDPSSNAEAMALKRAAAKFGLGLYLYQKSPGLLITKGGQSHGRFQCSAILFLLGKNTKYAPLRETYIIFKPV